MISSDAESAVTVAEQRDSSGIKYGSRINFLGVGVAAIAAFVASGLWYSPLLFGNLYVSVHGAEPGVMSPAEILIELGRTLVVAYVFPHLVMRCHPVCCAQSVAGALTVAKRASRGTTI